MKPRTWWQNGLVYLGYTAFFVFAFIACVYLTLPLDALQGYLVRKLSDEHGMDLTVERLSNSRESQYGFGSMFLPFGNSYLSMGPLGPLICLKPMWPSFPSRMKDHRRLPIRDPSLFCPRTIACSAHACSGPL